MSSDPSLTPAEAEFVACCAEMAARMQGEFARYDRENRFPDALHRTARELGLLDVGFPPELGGAGLSPLAQSLGVERLARVCAPVAFSIGFNHGALRPVMTAGTPEQRARIVGETVRAGRYAALALTEADVAGSNLLGLLTRAVPEPGGYRLFGRKVMVGNGGVASIFLVLARVEGEGGGLTFFAVRREAGVVVGPNTDKLGFRAVETPTVELDGVFVPAEDRIGAVGEGVAILLDVLDFIRVGGAAVILGLAAGALADGVSWVGQRRVYGGELLAQKSHVQLMMGELYGRLLLVREMAHLAARRLGAGEPFGREASIAKLEASRLAMDATAEVAQLFGWRGIDGEYAIQKRFRDARQTSIFEGTSEVQKLILARELVRRIELGEEP